MEHLSIWVFSILVYLVIIFVLRKGSKPSRIKEMFRFKAGAGSLLVGISIACSSFTIATCSLYSGIIVNDGISGLWFLWVSLLSSGVLVFLFAPVWAKLDFLSENEFLLMRYQGLWAKRLFRFRAYYVGLLITSIITCFFIIAFSDILIVLFDFGRLFSILLVTSILALNCFRSTMAEKRLADSFHFFLLAIILILAVILGMEQLGGYGHFKEALNLYNSERTAIFPQQGSTAFTAFLIFFGIQWWSASFFDGEGMEAQRLMSMKSKKHAIYAVVIQQFSLLLLSVLVVSVVFIALEKGLGVTLKPEQYFAKGLFAIFPDVLHPVLTITLLGLFLVSTESIINWGASLVYSDTTKQFRSTSKSSTYLIMIIIVIIAGILAVLGDSVRGLLEFLLGITAGVCPIIIGRWFSPRINAQVQMAVMIGAIVFTALCRLIFFFIEIDLNFIGGNYCAQLLIVTVLNLALAVFVSVKTFSQEDKTVFQVFSKRVMIKKNLGRSLLKAGGFSVLLLLVYVLVYAMVF